MMESVLYRAFGAGSSHLERAEALTAKALRLDPLLAQARLAKGFNHVARYEYAAAAAEARAVIADEPKNPRAWDLLGWMLAYVEPPRLDEAVEACRRAVQLDPEWHLPHYHLASALALAGKTAEAQRAIAVLKERSPQAVQVAYGHFWIELCAHRPREALAALGNRKYTALEGAWVAMALGQMGELDRAFTQLDEALAGGFRDVPSLRRSTWFEPLRRDPRFAALLSKHGIGLDR